MARQFPFLIPSDQEMRTQSQNRPVTDLGAGMPKLQESDLANKSEQDAIYELVTLGTQYSAALVQYSDRLQFRNRGKEHLIEEIDALQRLIVESNGKILELKQQNKDLKSLLTASVRLPNPLD